MPVIDRVDGRDRRGYEGVAAVEGDRGRHVGRREARLIHVVEAERVLPRSGLELGVSTSGTRVGRADERIALPARIGGAPQARARRHTGDRRDVELAVAIELHRRLAVVAVVKRRRGPGRVLAGQVPVAAPDVGAEDILAGTRADGPRRADLRPRRIALVDRLEREDADLVGHRAVDHRPGRDLGIGAGGGGGLAGLIGGRVQNVHVEIVDGRVRPLHGDRDDVGRV